MHLEARAASGATQQVPVGLMTVPNCMVGGFGVKIDPSSIVVHPPLFVAIDALGVVPIFLAMTAGRDDRTRRRLARQATLSALGVAILFLLVGKWVFAYMGITKDDFRIGGGVVLLVMAVNDLLFDNVRAAVLTSATLAVDGGFTYVKDRLGIEPSEELLLASPFRYEEQAVLYVPTGMPDPMDGAFVDRAADEIVRLLELSSGRAFVLFTSYANMNAVAERVAGRVEFPLLMQGEAPKHQLLDAFRRTPHAVLLATAAFWQGVDVAGEQLSCVIIDKLPFAHPGDPVVSARIDHIKSQGGNPFGEYQVPLAVLALKQGLGRLIRSASDRGILAVLDSRLMAKSYGRRFLESLPPARLVHDLRDVEGFVA